MSVIEEGYIDISPIPLSIKNMEKILEQMKKCVCKIKIGNKKGTGFFANIPYKSIYKNVLITNSHILNKDNIKMDSILTISINNEEEYKDIKIDDKRLILIDEEKDITIIEIKEKDINNFLEIDNRFNLNHLEERYRNESLYVLNYPKGKDIVVSYGLLKNMENEYLYHLCSTEVGSSGSPIISLDSFKLIGIHIGYSKTNKCNQGLFIKYAIDEFNKLENNILKKEKNTLNKISINEINNNSLLNLNNNIPAITNYDLGIKKMHLMVAYFYGDNSPDYFYKYSSRINEFIKQDKELINKKDIIKEINLFNEDYENSRLISELMLSDYYIFYCSLNKWLMNPNIYNNYYLESIAYFTSRIMYCLDKYGSESNGFLKEERTLYRGLSLDYNYLSFYENAKGKKIIIPAFSSCSELKTVAEKFAFFKKDQALFSVLFIIKFVPKINWLSNGINVQKITKYREEKEIIIQAFSFFYVKDVKIDNNKSTAEIYLESIDRKEILEEKLKYGKDIEYNVQDNIMQIKD